MKYLTIVLSTALAITGCASMRDSMLLGGAVGGASGAFVGNQIGEHDAKSTAIGAASGAAFGALIGWLGHKDKVQKDQQAAARRMQNPNQQKKVPGLNNAEVESLWIPPHIENDQYIDGHFIYTIKKNATWKQEN